MGMMMGEWALILGVLAILLQGFFAGSESAYVITNAVRAAHRTRKTRKQEKIIELLNNLDLVLVITLVGTNIAVVLSSFFLTTFFLEQLGEWGTTVAIIVGSVTGLIMGEYLPKSLARSRAESIVIATSGFFSISSAVSRPFRKLFRSKQSAQRQGERLSITRLDMLTAIQLGERIGSIEEKTSPRVANLFSAFDTPLADVMTPWDRVVTISAGSRRKTILNVIEKEGYTRYPVVDRRKGTIKGVLHAKDLLNAKFHLRQPFFTEPGARITELLKTMQNNRAHMAVVLDRNQEPMGLVTLEDLLEEFIGEIRSEE